MKAKANFPSHFFDHWEENQCYALGIHYLFHMANNEFNALVKCAEKLVDHFAACDLISTGAMLVGKKLIPFAVFSELDSLGTPLAKANKITQALMLSVKAESQKFKDLIVLLEKSDMSELAKIVQENFSKPLILVLDNIRPPPPPTPF